MRAAFRLARTGLHLCRGAASVVCVFPFLSVQARRRHKARWSRRLLEILGVRLCVAGTPPTGGFLVSNHISWLDIYAINASAPAAFVSKDDVRGWPLIGWLAANTETIFLERGSRSAAMQAKERMAAVLREGTLVGAFPEGTTSVGDTVLPFHAALFQAAVDAGVATVPAVLRYTERNGEASRAAAYVGDTSLWQCVKAVLAADRLTVHVDFLPAMEASMQDRRHLAAHAHRLIASRLARPGADTAVETPGDLPAAPPSAARPTDNPSPAPADSFPA